MNVNRIIKDRRSTYAFSNKALDEETLKLLFEAARWAPSSFNEQPWRFIYAHQTSEAYGKILESLYPPNQMWASKAPVLVLTVLNKFNSRSGKPNKYAWYDLGQAVGNISAQATDLGLKMHQMGGFDPVIARENFGIGESFEPASVIAIGYHGNIDGLEEGLQSRETSERSRKSLNEIAFRETWHEEQPVL